MAKNKDEKDNHIQKWFSRKFIMWLVIVAMTFLGLIPGEYVGILTLAYFGVNVAQKGVLGFSQKRASTIKEEPPCL